MFGQILGKKRKATRAAQPQKRSLIAWEYGTGLTHIVNILAVTRFLRAAGVDCLAMLHDNPAPQAFAELGVQTVQNFVWPAQRRSHPMATAQAHCVSDQMVNLGMASAQTMAAALAQYDAFFELFDPDVVLCERGYAALLAARGRRPVIAFGTGIPVSLNGVFPMETSATEPSYPVADVLSQLNGGLILSGRAPLTRIGDLLDGVTTMPFGPAAFDVYAPYRTQTLLPPFAPGIHEALPAGDGDEIFVYLHSFAQTNKEIMDALRSLPRPVRVFIHDLLPAARAELEAAGLAVEAHPADLKDIFRKSRCVLHHGGRQLTAACLAAGLPQTILARFADNRLALRFISERGLGTGMPLPEARTDAILAAARRCRDDAALFAHCRSSAPEFLAWFDQDSAQLVAAKALEMMSGEMGSIGV